MDGEGGMAGGGEVGQTGSHRTTEGDGRGSYNDKGEG